ncbi:CAP domain-containing protein [bacterium]|nr:MAG: CAP domain-containing protein [bacterium]
MLLAYLQEKAGDTGQARQTLQGVATPTGFTAAFLSRVGGSPTAIEAATTGQRNGTNPARLESTDARISRLEKLMWQIVNDERKSKRLPELAWNDDMAAVSRAHSAEMRDKKYFAHESPTPRLKDPIDRYLMGIGRTPRLVAENVFRAWGGRSFLTDNDIRDAHGSLMKSPGHRSNILIDGATKMGIGITSNATGDIWITQMFARD